MSICKLFGRLVGQSVCHNYLKNGKLHFHAPIGALVNIRHRTNSSTPLTPPHASNLHSKFWRVPRFARTTDLGVMSLLLRLLFITSGGKMMGEGVLY